MGLGIKRLDTLKLGQDPILTEFAQRFENTDFVSSLLLPEVKVAKQTGKFPVYGNEHMRVHDTKRPFKSPVKSMQLDDMTLKEFILDSYGLEIPIDYLESEYASDFLDLERYAADVLMASIKLTQEYEAVQLLQDSNTYSNDHYESLTTNEYFNDPDSDPISIIRDAQETVRKKINRKPNVIVFGQSTFNALQSHPKVLELIKYSQSAIITEDILSAIFSTKDNPVAIRIGSGMYEDKATNSNVDLWGDVAVMAYNPKIGNRPMTTFDQSFGKTLVQKGYPWAARTNDRLDIIRYVSVLTVYKHYISQKDAGFCIANTIGS